ncbi:uncharacterized protein LOC144923992 [Branchiostoma floridae x Branchiostoma belcheri]
MALCTCGAFLLVQLLYVSGFQPKQNISVLIEIPEDVSPGSEVLRPLEFVNSSTTNVAYAGNLQSWSVRITGGDDFGRFQVHDTSLTVTVAAPLDFELYSRYNLSVEVEHTRENQTWFINIVITVRDVSGYPPLYDKRCETPVLSDIGGTEDCTVLTSDGTMDAFLNGEHIVTAVDLIKWHTGDPSVVNNVVVMRDDCSILLLIGMTTLIGRKAFMAPWLHGFGAGRLEVQCHYKNRKDAGKMTLLDISFDNNLPRWVQESRIKIDESVRYVVAAELNDVWSTTNRIRCGKNVSFSDSPVLAEITAEYNITGCPEGRYGLYCDHDCVCKNGARCHGFNGACKCRPGWRGRACDIPWAEVVIIATPGDSVVKYIGTNLTLTCLAPHIQVANMTWLYEAENKNTDTEMIEKGPVQNSSVKFQPIYESANGRYTCLVKAEDGERFNTTFILSVKECPPNRYGDVCSHVCDCEYGGTCDRWEGCLCPPGRHGDMCEHECAPGTFGWNCSMKCNCENKVLCDPVNGNCICAEGQWGEFCHECAPGTFGWNCSMKCHCFNNASCDAVNGSCICAAGQFGEFCQDVYVPRDSKIFVVALASVLPTIVVILCIVTGILVHRSRRRPKYTVDMELTPVMETLSSWEVDKNDISFEHMIGEGEFGTVVRGRLHVPELGYEVLVAAKSIRPDRMTASAVRDFRREMDILARIHENKEGHPNLVKFYGVLTNSDPQYIVVEYANNEDLRRYLWTLREECKITGHTKLLERLGFASDVACGLVELARLKIVHRDIAARNVVISDTKVAKIADFGLSRDVYESTAYERTNQGGEEELLPLKWMAVESLRDGVYTCESDVWSYGVLLWKIASFGEEPRYAGGPMHPDVCTMLELLRKGVRLQKPHNCPQPLYRIIRSCWIVDPSKRPTPEELWRNIDQLKPPRHAAHLVNHNFH